MVPEGWKVETLGSLCDVKGGKRLPKGRSLSQEKTPFPYIRVSDMRDGYVDTSDIRYVPADIAPLISRYTISTNDLFISVAGTLGIVGKVPPELDGANLTENADKLTNIRADRDYLLAVLQSHLVQKSIENEKTQNAQPKLALERIRGFRVPVPPLPEQKKIADILSTWDKAIETTEKLLANAENQKRALMQQLLTGKRRLRGFEGKNWKQVNLGDIIEINYGKSPNGVASEAGAYPIIGTGGETGRTDSWLFRGPAIVIGRKGTIDKPSIIDCAFWPIDTTFVCTAKSDYDLHWAYRAIQRINLRRYNEASGVPSLSRETLRAISLNVPSLEEQRDIAAIIDNADEECRNLAGQSAELATEKRALMQQLLTGKRRVTV